MNSLRTSIRNQAGFTIVELTIVIAIFGALVLMGLFFDFTFYRGTSFGTDVDTFAAVLQRARARAINNIDSSAVAGVPNDHGVYIDANKYVLFQGASYALRDSSQDQNISRNVGINFGGTSEIVFRELSGNSNFEGTINISGYGKSTTFVINYEGLINR